MMEINKMATLYPKCLLLNFFAVILAMTMVYSCKNALPSLTKSEKTIIVDSILETLHEYHTDIVKEGFSAEIKYLDNSDDFFWVPPGYATPISYDSVRTVLKQNAPLYISINNSWDTLMVIPISKKHATFAGRFSTTMTDTSGKKTRLKLIETGLLVKRENGWKLLSGQTSIIKQVKKGL